MTIPQLLSILERMNPESLLLVRGETGLGDELLAELFRRVSFTVDPERRLAHLEYLLLVMHEARQVDPDRYLREVFLPFTGIQRRLKDQIGRIIDEIKASDRFPENSVEDAAHQATKVYRPLVADVLDPYLTLLVATYQFIEGEFVDMASANFRFGERQKAEWIEARARRTGGPADLLDGYDPVVRNALSHPGSDGVVYRDGHVVFREIKRPGGKFETRRWTNDELYRNGTSLIDFAMAVDAACEVFGVDNMDALIEEGMIADFLQHAAGREERLALARATDTRLERIRCDGDASLEDRRDRLGRILFRLYARRDLQCSGLAFSDEQRAVCVIVPWDEPPRADADDGLRAAGLIRYLVLARAVFGRLPERFVAEARVGGRPVMTVELPSASLEEYATEQAGLLDLLEDAAILTTGGRIGIKYDRAVVEAQEDASLDPPLPRRDRTVWEASATQ